MNLFTISLRNSQVLWEIVFFAKKKSSRTLLALLYGWFQKMMQEYIFLRNSSSVSLRNFTSDFSRIFPTVLQKKSNIQNIHHGAIYSKRLHLVRSMDSLRTLPRDFHLWNVFQKKKRTPSENIRAIVLEIPPIISIKDPTSIHSRVSSLSYS